MGFTIPSETEAELAVGLRRESFNIHRGGLSYGPHGEQHMELPLEDAGPLIVLLHELLRTAGLPAPADVAR